ncbi:hypothetical protein BDV96DRAFT_649057 [Lophiotrema nucula]|uniref:Uncharacterized protein n=1 Tax=Lophiotrema nucula TaxID=690887 RepID=A0A6A5YYR3_9PLEO|nr:hypothetical protein BDV96DRAFT_649057 [Lophiotrema nucula]
MEDELGPNINDFFRTHKKAADLHYLKHAGKFPGVFQVPVCRNKSGEAISSVWDTKARNFPCICGEHRWTKEHNVYEEADVNERFYMLSRLYASEDFEDFCHHELHCKGENKHNWQFQIEEGMPPKDPELKHAWKKCKKPQAHTTHGNVEAGRKEGAAENQNPANSGKGSLNASESFDLCGDGLLWRA